MTKSTNKESVQIKQWAHRGNMLVNTSALGYNDPEHPYNQIVAQGCRPEDFGIEHPMANRFDGVSRGQLIEEILQLEAELESRERFQQ